MIFNTIYFQNQAKK